MAEGYFTRLEGVMAPKATVKSDKCEIREGGSYTETFPPKEGDRILQIKDGLREDTRLVFKRLLYNDEAVHIWGTEVKT